MVDHKFVSSFALQPLIVSVGGRDWLIHCAQDDNALLELADNREPFPFGLLLWESAVALAEAIAEAPDGTLAGSRVLEIGCGVGLAGLAAAHLGGRVTMTDHDPLALDAARLNAAANGISGVTFVEADWSQWQAAGVGAGATMGSMRFDLVIGADVIYDHTIHDDVLRVIAATLTPGGLALLADPCRHHQPEFINRARASGFSVETTMRPVADLRQPGQTVSITLISLRRSRCQEVRAGD